jgi:hypothetical protein
MKQFYLLLEKDFTFIFLGKICLIRALVAFHLFLGVSSEAWGQCTPAQRLQDSLALVDLYNSTNGSGWTNNTNWLVPGQPLGTWYGVTTNAQGCVTCIDMDETPNCSDSYTGGNNLSGNIPNFNLPNLLNLYLSGNQLSGNIPNFSNLPNLRGLYLYNNQLSGNIPNFSNLPNLQVLYLYNNQLSGNIPNFSSLPNLQELGLSNNQLSGSIPNFNLPNLEILWLANNQLSGSIPNFNLPNLESLFLSNNQLNGSMRFPPFFDQKTT